MGLYVTSVEDAEKKGRKVELLPTLAKTREQLQKDEALCAIAQRHHGKVGLVILTEGDHRAVQTTPAGLVGVFAIPQSLVPK